MKNLLLAGLAALILSGCSSNEAEVAKARDGVTKAEADRVKTDMSYAQVSQIVGEPGTETHRTEKLWGKSVTYVWRNADGSSLTCSFWNDTLVTKMEMRLH